MIETEFTARDTPLDWPDKRRHTVGILLDSHLYTGMNPSWFYSPIIRGAQTAARENGVNLLVACGILDESSADRYRLAWPTLDESVDFVPVGPWNTDGLLVFSPLRTEERIQYIRELRERKFPMLFIGSGSGIPTIMPDNEGGIRQALEHLVGHGHREIAFIAGDPQDSGDSFARVEAYRQGVRELNLSDDPRLLEYGLHWDEEAYRATKRLLASRVKFTAVMCSNDFSSLGVVRALNEAGLRIPWDVAVTGFDDQPEALVQIPPLTSVHYPLYETGYRALVLIRERMDEGPESLPMTVRVSTRLMTRQSCGCFPEMVSAAALNETEFFEKSTSDPALRKEKLTQSMMKALRSQSILANHVEFGALCDRLVTGFLQSQESGDPSHFRVALMQVLQRIESLDDDAHAWQAAISVLRLGTCADQGKGPGAAPNSAGENPREDLLHQARTLLSESTRRRYVRLQLLQTHRDESMGRLTAKLLSSLDEIQIQNALAEDLPKIGVSGAKVAFFEPREGDRVANSIIYAKSSTHPGLRFESRTFPPPGLYPEDQPFSLALLPLFHRNESLGYVAFDADDLRPLAAVAVQLAAALNNARLHNEVTQLSLTDGLTDVYNRRYFEILLQKEAERGQRYNRDLAVVMIDIDRFKEYNDVFGHPAGDEALRVVARCICNGARRGLDVVTRYGGDEFGVILPETDREGARIVAENIHAQLNAETKFLHRLTISLGIASLRGDQIRVPELVERADRALYRAKDQGRDRVVIYADCEAEPATE